MAHNVANINSCHKMRLWKHLYLLPLSVFLGFIVTFFTTYTIAVQLDHVKPDFPYISDGGACPPESCIFGQMLNMTAVLLGLTVYVRYSLVEDYYSCGHMRARWERWLNVAGAVCGMSGAVGISIVGNFQVTNALGMHLLGAMLAFFLGVFYCWIQVPITYRTRPDMTRPWLTWVRLLIAVLCSVLFISGWVCAAATPAEFSHRLTNSIKACNASEIPDSEWGMPSHGWEYHVCSTASEWAVGLLFSVFLLTFVYEFRLVTVEKPKLLRVASVLHQRRWVGIECLEPPPPLLARRSRRAPPTVAPVSTGAHRHAYSTVNQAEGGVS
ncbi:DNA damage-regulated autophagy modulator protein 2 [Amphibalanus amphitrite]|uniref:DNA damage-regulated autophagy modulator protein 2 n=1 Tax=Amphibalanus amphitrite TaxID=1232801 RepID=A0A6A4VBD4_AMPAM|nr:DNA damage-regulated autophagy modulator protein 2 [Amphibalanus amphitrite]